MASVLTLNWTVAPWSTLMSAAKPWMLASPAPATSHSLAGLPALQFSATISLGEAELQCAGAGAQPETAAAIHRPEPPVGEHLSARPLNPYRASRRTCRRACHGTAAGRLRSSALQRARRGGRAVECGGLENRWPGTPGPEGSNPSPSAQDSDLPANQPFPDRQVRRWERCPIAAGDRRKPPDLGGDSPMGVPWRPGGISATCGNGWATGGSAPRTFVAVLRQAIEDQRAARADAAIGRLALSKCEAADALGVSVDFLEEHVMHELRIVRCGRRRLIPVAELQRWLSDHARTVFEEPGAARGEHVHANPRRKS